MLTKESNPHWNEVSQLNQRQNRAELSILICTLVWSNLRINAAPQFHSDQHFYCRDIIFGSKLGQIGTKWEKSGTSSDQFSGPFDSPSLIWYLQFPDLSHVDRWAKMNRKIISKNSRFVPYDANLTHFEHKPDITDSDTDGWYRSHTWLVMITSC